MILPIMSSLRVVKLDSIMVFSENGDSLWSAVAWNRFGSQFRVCGNDRRGSPLGSFGWKSVESERTTKAVPSNRAPKAPPIYTQASVNLDHTFEIYRAK